MDESKGSKLLPPGIEDSNSSSPASGSPNITTFKIQTSQKGVENAKKRLRAFSIQKKLPIAGTNVGLSSPKPGTSGGPTVVIGKVPGSKTVIKPAAKPLPMPSVKPIPYEPEEKKLIPKPSKPSTYMINVKQRTLEEIEEIKRKLELVELGIPLGLIGPATNSPASKAMPTKAMPPIKSFLTTEQLDEIIKEAKQARAEGREFKFDYQKLLPNYDNPFQRKKEDKTETEKKEREKSYHYSDKDRRKSDKYDSRYKKHSSYRKDERRHRDYDRDRGRRDRKDRPKEDKPKEVKVENTPDSVGKAKGKETDVNLNDYLVCDSWSLDNDDKDTSSPQVEVKKADNTEVKQVAPNDLLRESILKKKQIIEQNIRNMEKAESPQTKMKPNDQTKDVVVEKLRPVTDSFTYEIDDEPVLDIFDESNDLEKYANNKLKETDKADDSQDASKDMEMNDEFLESMINEIKTEDMTDDISQDKRLVGYGVSPEMESSYGTPEKTKSTSVTPDLDRSSRSDSSMRSSDSGFKSRDKSVESRNEVDESLETWSFVLKICQPLLFRHDRNKCYKETKCQPKMWYATNPKLCDCVKDRSVVYEELEMCKTSLVDKVYSAEGYQTKPAPTKREWYPRANSCLVETKTIDMSNEWENEEDVVKVKETKSKSSNNEVVSLDKEYQRFMDAVWPDVADEKKESTSTTPTKDVSRKQKISTEDENKRAKKMKLSSEGWSQESDVEDEDRGTKKKAKKMEKVKRKRKRSSSGDSSDDDDDDDKSSKKKVSKKDVKKKSKAKRRRLEKKYLKKLKEKTNKKSKKNKEKSDKKDSDDDEKEKKKSKKKKQLKLKKKEQKRKRKSSTSSSSDSDSDSSDTDSSQETKRTKNKKGDSRSTKKDKKKKKRKQSTSDSTQSEDLFDVNVLNNIKTEKSDKKLSDIQDFSPRRQASKPRPEIISMNELQNDFESNNMQIKKEVDDKKAVEKQTDGGDETVSEQLEDVSAKTVSDDKVDKEDVSVIEESPESEQFHQKEILPYDVPLPLKSMAEESNSQASSQESSSSIKEVQNYEKDDSHLRPSSQNSNYSFNDVINASHRSKDGSEELADYEMYEQMAMEYQSGVASQPPETLAQPSTCQRIETVVGPPRGEIKCDWRPGDGVARPSHTTSRWGLKPGEANIVLTGQNQKEERSQVFPIGSVLEQGRNYQEHFASGESIGYDEAYADVYAASDKLQYGDCFAEPELEPAPVARVSLDERIHTVLRETALAEGRKEENIKEEDDSNEDKGILVTKSSGRAPKRVSFADGYKPGQDSDTEAPPVKKKRSRRYGCAWPCPATHPDHVPLWDALPPPPPPTSPPPPPPPRAPPLHLLRGAPAVRPTLLHAPIKFDPNAIAIPGIMSEPPPGFMGMPPGPM